MNDGWALNDIPRTKPLEVVSLRQCHFPGRIVINPTLPQFGVLGLETACLLGSEHGRLDQATRAKPKIYKLDAGCAKRRATAETTLVKLLEFLHQRIDRGRRERWRPAQRRDHLMDLTPIANFDGKLEADAILRETFIHQSVPGVPGHGFEQGIDEFDIGRQRHRFRAGIFMDHVRGHHSERAVDRCRERNDYTPHREVLCKGAGKQAAASTKGMNIKIPRIETTLDRNLAD